MDINKYFNERLYIIKQDGEIICIERKNVYINDSSQYTGFVNMIYDGENIIVLREIYSYDDNRLRYSYDEYVKPKIFDTYEKEEGSGEEKAITVIEDYDKKENKIGSIGNIDKFDSDKGIIPEIKKPKIYKLLRPKEEKQNLLAA